jgi:hypothetical protein
MVKQSDLDLPVIFKNQLLFKSGNWNHASFSNEMVDKSVSNTKWSSLNKRLYFKHDNEYDISQWKGKVENITASNGQVRGDVQIWDANEAIQILYGQKPIALSADIEYNNEGVMYFTGFALEADPGVRDKEMFLSDAVKNDMNGYYHAKFSNQIEIPTEVKVESQSQSLDTNNYTTERGLEENKQKSNMENELKQVSENVSNIENKIDSLVNKFAEMDKDKVETEVKTEPVMVKEEPMKEPIVNQETVVEKQLPMVNSNQSELNDNVINTIVDKITQKLQPSIVPLTVHEFSGYVDREEEVVDRLEKSLAKI